MGKQKQRVKRPILTRTAPDRRFRGVVDARPTSKGPQSANNPAGAESEGNPEARAASYEAVNNAYRVVDEYVRQGQQFAEQFWLPGARTGSMGMQDVTRVFERFLRSAGDTGAAWLEMMSQWSSSPADGGGAPTGTAGPFGAGRETRAREAPDVRHGAAGATGLSVVVESSRRFRISVDLHPSAERADLDLRELTTADRSLPAITDIHLQTDSSDSRLTIRVRIPDGQPPGVYNGLLVARGTQRPAGTVSLSLE